MKRAMMVVLVVCVSVFLGDGFDQPVKAAQAGIWFLNNSGSHVKLYLDDRLNCELPPGESCTVEFSDGAHVVRADLSDGGSQTLNVNQYTPQHIRIRNGYFEDAVDDTRL